MQRKYSSRQVITLWSLVLLPLLLTVSYAAASSKKEPVPVKTMILTVELMMYETEEEVAVVCDVHDKEGVLLPVKGCTKTYPTSIPKIWAVMPKSFCDIYPLTALGHEVLHAMKYHHDSGAKTSITTAEICIHGEFTH